MFKRIVIHLSEPLCDCETEDLGWRPDINVLADGTKTYELVLNCKRCGTCLTVPHTKFKAAMLLEKGYPKPSINGREAADKFEDKDKAADTFLETVRNLIVPKKEEKK